MVESLGRVVQCCGEERITSLALPFHREGKRIAEFPPRVTVQNLVDLRSRIVDATLRVAETSSVAAASTSALAVVLRCEYEPRSRESKRARAAAWQARNST